MLKVLSPWFSVYSGMCLMIWTGGWAGWGELSCLPSQRWWGPDGEIIWNWNPLPVLAVIEFLTPKPLPALCLNLAAFRKLLLSGIPPPSPGENTISLSAPCQTAGWLFTSVSSLCSLPYHSSLHNPQVLWRTIVLKPKFRHGKNIITGSETL